MDVVERICEDGSKLHRDLTRWMLAQGIPMESCLVAARIFVRASEAALQQFSADRFTDYRSALGQVIAHTDESIRQKGMKLEPLDSSGPNSLPPCPTEGDPDELTAAQLSTQAANLTSDLGQIVMASGYSLEAFCLACAGGLATSESVLKSEPDGRYERYQMALAVTRDDVAVALKKEGIKERPSS